MDIRSEFEAMDLDKTITGEIRPTASGSLKAGSVLLEHYKVLSLLGKGGMGVVYECFNEVSGIKVAVKTLAPELSASSWEMEKVRDNFQLVYNLHHPNIASYNTLERDKVSGLYYLVMEYVDGQDLRYYLRDQKMNGNFTDELVNKLVRQMAEALDYAHQQNILHRDIKPGNIMVDRKGNIKLLDFGLASQIHTSLSRVSMHQVDTSGTVPYMAPEQWRGLQVTPAADQYALAATVYEIYAGHPPFENPDKDVMRSCVLNEMPQPLKNMTPHSWAALNKALSKNPEERFDCCASFASALATPPLPAAADTPVSQPAIRIQEPIPAAYPVNTPQPAPNPAEPATPDPASHTTENPQIKIQPTNRNHGNTDVNLYISTLPDGNFLLRGNIAQAHHIITQSMLNLGMAINYSDTSRITATARYYLINGIRINAMFSRRNDDVILTLMASLLSGLDVHGACEKKVMELKHQFIAAASVLPTCRIVANKQQMPQQNYQSAANRVQTQNLDPTPRRQPSTPFNNTTANGAALQVWPVQNGLFSLRGNIEFAHRMVIRAMQECNVTIKHSDPTSITGKMPIGINLFGITIKAFFYANGDTVTLRFSATFTDAVDIWGSGDKKIQLISNRLIELCKADPTVELHYQSNPQR